MKHVHKTLLLSIIIGLSIIVWASTSSIAQSHLVATYGGITSTSVNHGDNFECNFTIKNIGTSTSVGSYAYVCVSPDTFFSTVNYATASTVKSLTAGDSTTLYFTFSVPANYSAGIYFMGININGIVYRLIGLPFQITSATNHTTKIPYPIIFIHGLNSCDTIWNNFTDNLDDIYGLQWGGRMNFCLNSDDDIHYSKLSTDYTDFTAINNTLTVGDYYYVNFAVDKYGNNDRDGSAPTYMYSSQSAIYKQGKAVQDAIKHVLQITGRDKVILVGHSMGGLAAREYLQNPSKYQTDGEHHVAKLFTIGTPHGGSNATSSFLGALYGGLHESSEAVRDLRFHSSTYDGWFLNGGLETASVTSSVIYNNVDVDCNGNVGDFIVGLNQKSIPIDLSYACTIGTGVGGTGDGIVDADKANVNDLYSTNFADTFIDNDNGIWHTVLGFSVFRESHTLLPRNFPINMKGLDESSNHTYDYPYHISLNKSYYGFIQEQSHAPSATTRDYDNYSFSITQKGTLSIKIENIIAPDFKLWLIDSANSAFAVLTFPISSNQNGNIDVSIQLPVGRYVLMTDAQAITNSYDYPYLIKTEFTPNWTSHYETICQGAVKTLTAPSGFLHYDWNTGATTQSISASTSGYYYFKTTNDSGYVSQWSDSFYVNVIPPPTVGAISGASNVCAGAQIALSSTGTLGGTWSSSSGNATVNAAGMVTGVSAGNATITYSVTNSCSITKQWVHPITVNAQPDAGTITGAKYNVCVGEKIFLTSTVSGGTWSSSNNRVFVSGGLVSGFSEGTSVVTYTSTTACGTASTNKTITVRPLPELPIITQNYNQLSVPLFDGFYQWTVNGQKINGAVSLVYNVLATGQYGMTETTIYGCVAKSPLVLVSDIDYGVNDIKTYPNPTTSMVYIDWYKAVTVRVGTMDGKTVKTLPWVNKFDMSELPSGTYWITLFDEKNTMLKTEMIKKL